MGYGELIESLRKEGDEKVQLIWQKAEAEAERIRTETSQRVEHLREEYKKRQAEAVAELVDAIVSKAKSRARKIKLLAEKNLSDRLYSVAKSSLNSLRDEKYRDVFDALIKELPPITWRTIRINPEDVEVAREYFPDSEIITDRNITGGIEVMTEDGRIRVLNTFEKRLERAWEGMLQLMIRDIYKNEFLL